MPAKKTTEKKITSPKKTAPKKIVIKKENDAVVKESTVKSFFSEKRNILSRIRRSHIIAVVVLLLVVAAIFFSRNIFVAAMVNGEPVYRYSVVKELEKQGGKQVINSLVTKTLILQEARKQNVSVGKDEIDGEIKKIEDDLKQQGQDLDQALLFQGMSRQDLYEQIRLKKMVEKMVGKDVQISEEEIDKYIEENQESLGENASSASARTDIKNQLTQQKTNEKLQIWLQDIQKNAKIDYLVNY